MTDVQNRVKGGMGGGGGGVSGYDGTKHYNELRDSIHDLRNEYTRSANAKPQVEAS